MSFKQNKAKDDKIHQLFLFSNLHRHPRCCLCSWSKTISHLEHEVLNKLCKCTVIDFVLGFFSLISRNPTQPKSVCTIKEWWWAQTDVCFITWFPHIWGYAFSSQNSTLVTISQFQLSFRLYKFMFEWLCLQANQGICAKESQGQLQPSLQTTTSWSRTTMAATTITAQSVWKLHSEFRGHRYVNQ